MIRPAARPPRDLRPIADCPICGRPVHARITRHHQAGQHHLVAADIHHSCTALEDR